MKISLFTLFALSLFTVQVQAADCISSIDNKSYKEGSQVYNSTTHQMLYCNGTSFTSFTGSSGPQQQALPTILPGSQFKNVQGASNKPAATYALSSFPTALYLQYAFTCNNGGAGSYGGVEFLDANGNSLLKLQLCNIIGGSAGIDNTTGTSGYSAGMMPIVKGTATINIIAYGTMENHYGMSTASATTQLIGN